MTDIVRTEEIANQNSLSNEYEILISKFPLKSLSEASRSKVSFPDWEVSDGERNWANSYLDLGKNAEVLKIFGESVGRIGERGLQLLRDQSIKRGREMLEDIGKNMTPDSLLALLRNKFQSDALFLEEGLRGVRTMEDYWAGEGNQLAVALKWLKLSREAFSEIGDFQTGKTRRLDMTKHWIDANFNATSNVASHNENFYRENLGNGFSQKVAESSAKQDTKDLVFWSSLKGFVDNLELTAEQGNKD